MDAERWRCINEVFHAALQCDPETRDAFLDEACGDDAPLRDEVESLLRAHDDAGGFIETAAFDVGAELLESGGEARSSAVELVGSRVGPYVIESSIGRGGMGVVYLAEDTRLDRKVAIKMLADHLGRDQRSRERLRREARAAAALSHPGIATVYALEELDGHLYIVYEYAEGETLRDEMARGPVRGAPLLDTALAIARALAAAHELGIVHRDLKPENVIRTRDGSIKILDFGLASFQRPAATSSVPTEGEARLTLPGMLLGTPSYMSPEQLKGLDVDFRSDLFSFGVLVHEMAVGVHPFEGDDLASTIARILEVEPREVPSAAEIDPPGLRPVVRRLLRKSPEQRYAATTELVVALEGLADGEATSDPGDVAAVADDRSAPPRHGPLWWWRFHQLALAAVYGATYYGLWWVKQWSSAGGGALAAMLLFYAAVAPLVVAGSLRLHLAFASRYYPEELRAQQRRAKPWIRFAELLYAFTLVGGAAVLDGARPLFSALLVAAAVGILVFAQMIEPTTTRAAFGRD